MRAKKTNEKNNLPKWGFTLIELLVVIAIIAILATILMPSIQRAKELAKRSACLSNLHSHGVAINMYSCEIGTIPPRSRAYAPYTTYWLMGADANLNTIPIGLYSLYVTEYIESPELTSCPACREPSFTYDDPSNPWPGRSSYQYAPPFTYYTNPTGRVTLDELDPEIPVVFDIVPWGLNHNGELWNYLRADMSAATYNDDDGFLYSYINANIVAVLQDNPTFESLLRDYFK